MSTTGKYTILTGPLAGQTVVAHQCWCHATPNDGVMDLSLGHGIWIPELQMRVAADSDRFAEPTAYVDLVVPYDRFDQEILVGDTLHAVSKTMVVRVKVLGFNKPVFSNSRMTRQLKVVDIDTQRKFAINDPSETIRISGV